MPPSGVDYASEFLNGYAPEYVDNFFDENEYLIKKTIKYFVFKIKVVPLHSQKRPWRNW